MSAYATLFYVWSTFGMQVEFAGTNHNLIVSLGIVKNA